MEQQHAITLVTRVVALERQIRVYRTLTAVLGGLILLLVSLGARPTPSLFPHLQTHQLEVVDEAGKRLMTVGTDTAGGLLQLWNQAGVVSLKAYATAAGGRVEIFQPSGVLTFSAGARQGAPDPVGLWEQTLRTVERQGRELDGQRRTLDDLSRRVQAARQSAGGNAGSPPLSQEFQQLRHEVEQQRRSLDTLERHLYSLTAQVRTLERH